MRSERRRKKNANTGREVKIFLLFFLSASPPKHKEDKRSCGQSLTVYVQLETLSSSSLLLEASGRVD